MTIRKMSANIEEIVLLSETACEVHLALPEPLLFVPGAFVNVFMTVRGINMRRAYSISSDPRNQTHISLSIRKGSEEGMSVEFFKPGITNVPLEIMGPLGLNTLDKISRPRVFLFGFGIGASVIKGILHGLIERKDSREIMILTGNRTEDEILYKEYFESVAAHDSRVKVRFVVSRPRNASYPYTGYIQDHIADLDMNGSSVYICGKKAMCEQLREGIEQRTSVTPEFLIEAFD